MAQQDVIDLFGVGDEGCLYDLTDATTLFTDSSRTSAASIGDAVEGVTDLSGNDNHAVKATSSGAPIYRGWPKTVGSNLVTNPFFATDTTWSKGTGWSIASDKATKTAGTASNLTQTISLTAGESYLINILYERTAGTFDIEFHGTTTVTADVSTVDGGRYYVLTAVTGNNTISVTADSSFAGDIHEVVVQQITSWRGLGLHFDKNNSDKIWSSAFDASGTGKATVGYMLEQRPANGNAYIANFRSAASRPSFRDGLVTKPEHIMYDTGSGNTEAQDTTNVNPRFLLINQYDMAGASATTRVIPTPHGVDKTAEHTYADTWATGTAWQSSAQLSVGGPYVNNTWFDGVIHKVFFINRLLNSTELATLEEWLKAGFIYVGHVGDSTTDQNTAADSAASSFQQSVTGLSSQCIHTSMLVADWGDDISEQETDWATLPSEDKANLDLVVVGGFHNDVKGRIGEGTATITTVMSDLQGFIDTIATDCPGAKIYVLGCTPCKQWLDTASQPADAYQGWQDYNSQISTLTNVDAVITAFNDELNDGSGNLKSEYQAYDDGVHPSTRSRFVVAREIEAQIDADFFTTATATDRLTFSPTSSVTRSVTRGITEGV